MVDTLSERERSELMSKVKGKGNKSTELLAERILLANGYTDWVKHPKEIPGRPDFYFPTLRLALFIDGCFWHACPKCGRIPKTRSEWWQDKIEGNRRRDSSVNRMLWSERYHIIRIGFHTN